MTTGGVSSSLAPDAVEAIVDGGVGVAKVDPRTARREFIASIHSRLATGLPTRVFHYGLSFHAGT